MNGYFGFEKGFHGLSDIPTLFQEKIDQTVNYQTPVWLENMKIVTKGIKKNTGKNYTRY